MEELLLDSLAFLEVCGLLLQGEFLFELNLLSDLSGVVVEEVLAFLLGDEFLLSLGLLLNENPIKGVSLLLCLVCKSSLLVHHLELSGLEELLLDSLLK